MKLLALRVVAVCVLVGLYSLDASIGVAALACGIGFVIGRHQRPTTPTVQST